MNTIKPILLAVLTLISMNIRSQNALDLDGTDDRVDCGADTSIQITGKALTLEAWIYPTQWKTNIYDGNIINKENNTSNYGYMLRCGAGGKLNFAFGSGAWSELNSANAVLSLNTWQHVAGTYDGAKLRLYVNGVATDSVAATASIVNASTPNLMIGANVLYSRYYQGMVDEVRIWSICRTQKQLYDNMSREFCSPNKGLRAYYKFNQGKAGAANSFYKTLPDYSIYGNNGTLTNFALTGGGSNWLKGISLGRTVASKSDTAVRCDTYTSPSGKYKWTKSGVYNDTIQIGAFNCDSIITTYLTIKKSSLKSISVFACKSYKSPSGLYTWTKTGTYKDYLKNYLQCDSVLTIFLKIGGSLDTISRTACNSYKGPAGKTYTQSGFHNDTLKGYKNCDSVIVIKLTIIKAALGNITAKTCKFYGSPSGKYVYKTTGVYTDTIKNYQACDSIITINLKIMSSSGTVNRSACKQFKSPSGKYTWAVSGTYKDTIVNLIGCDSFVTINLSILGATTGTTSISACRFYKSTGKKRIWTSSGTYKDTLPNYRGCDSILTINLTIKTIDDAVTLSGKTLTATNSTGTYKWLDCNTALSVITGETNRSFTPTKSGSYAVEITDNSCMDTSACTAVTVVSVDRLNTQITFGVQPNPNNGTFEITLPVECANAVIRIRDVSGKLIFEQTYEKLKQTKLQVDQLKTSGIYLIEIDAPTFKAVRTISVEF